MTSEVPRPRYIYKNCPIVEAIIEVRFSPDGWDSTVPLRIYENVREKFPEKRDIQQLSIFIGSPAGGPPPPPPPISQAPTMQLWNIDKSQLLQLGPGLATANSLKYTTFPDFLPSVKMVINQYLEVAKPSKVMRIATRYINRFQFAEEELNLEKYFKFGMMLPKPITDLEGFDLTFLCKGPALVAEGDKKIRTRFATEQTSDVILDIDCYADGEIPPDPTNLLDAANKFHDHVEDVFESFLQDDLRTLLGATRQ